jgi:hypothetical protein
MEQQAQMQQMTGQPNPQSWATNSAGNVAVAQASAAQVMQWKTNAPSSNINNQ